MSKLKLKNHPRLFIKSDLRSYLEENLSNPYVKNEADGVLADANRLVKKKPLTWNDITDRLYPTSHEIASQVENLAGAYAITKDLKYRKAAIARIKELTKFTHISCEAHKKRPVDQEDFFCLTYGWHSVAVAYLYDMIKQDITAEEDSIIIGFLDKHLMKRAIQCINRPPWWANAAWSNWNGVCAGGMGILALSFYDRYPEAKKIIDWVDKSLDEYFRSYITNGGGCPEGTGYYNYGMQFSIPYIHCWENATGRKHSALKIKELGKSLNFPMDFHKMTFGDNDGWGPTGYHFYLADRMGESMASLKAASFMDVKSEKKPKRKNSGHGAHRGTNLYVASYIPTPEEVAKFRKKHEGKKNPAARVYSGLGWSAMFDNEAFPTLRMVVRGSTTAQAGHASQDQFSFKCMVNNECFITDQHDRPGVSFTKRGNDVYGRSAASKSGLFIEGLGCDISLKEDTTEEVIGKGLTGLRVFGGGCYLHRWQGSFIGRTFLLVDGKYWLIVDSQSAGANSMDARFQTFAEGRHGKDWVRLKSGKERLTLSFASIDKAIVQTSAGFPTWAEKQTSIYRWITSENKNNNVFATVLNPGNQKLDVEIEREPTGSMTIKIKESARKTRKIRLSKELKLLK